MTRNQPEKKEQRGSYERGCSVERNNREIPEMTRNIRNLYDDVLGVLIHAGSARLLVGKTKW